MHEDRTINACAGLMPLMARLLLPDCRRVRIFTAAVWMAGVLTSCESVSTAPPDSHVAGSWRLDSSASDDPDALIAKAVNEAESKLRHRLAKYGYAPDPAANSGGHDSSGEAPDYSYDTPGDRYGGPGLVGPDFRGLRLRLREALLPPRQLQLEFDGDLVSIAEDQLPARDYRTGERLSRIDNYGTSVITASWDHDEFVLKSSYSSPRASHTQSFRVNPATGALLLTQQLNDPTVGKIVVHTVYRRE
jgi:hypothetical protein